MRFTRFRRNPALEVPKMPWQWIDGSLLQSAQLARGDGERLRIRVVWNLMETGRGGAGHAFDSADFTFTLADLQQGLAELPDHDPSDVAGLSPAEAALFVASVMAYNDMGSFVVGPRGSATDVIPRGATLYPGAKQHLAQIRGDVRKGRRDYYENGRRR